MNRPAPPPSMLRRSVFVSPAVRGTAAPTRRRSMPTDRVAKQSRNAESAQGQVDSAGIGTDSSRSLSRVFRAAGWSGLLAIACLWVFCPEPLRSGGGAWIILSASVLALVAGYFPYARGELPESETVRSVAGPGHAESAESADILTDRTPLDDQLRQGQKMEAIGRLAGGVAHDFNNLITIISGYSDMLLESLPANDAAREMVGAIKKASERAAGLTRQLLAFSRKQVLKPRRVDLNTLIADFDTLLRRLIRENIVLTTTTAAEPLPVLIDPGQIEQVVMNLVINSRDAMPHGGKLNVTASRADELARRRASDADLPIGPYALLTVSDTGSGMDAETRAHLFEPFFTTKEPGKGTGLGLATVYGIVRQSGGRIDVQSAPGQGTIFRIALPLSPEAPPPAAGTPQRASVVRGTETVLLVEDEDGVRLLAREALRAAGYRVVEASHGVEALVRVRQHHGPIHLLVTDVIMPHMGGPELVERLSEMFPDVKTIYMSGYTDSTVVHEGVLSRSVAFLDKPFTSDELTREVRRVLDERPGAGQAPTQGPE
jgi:two-component system cell cycle sensor histidine kinase/response regulator CckA